MGGGWIRFWGYVAYAVLVLGAQAWVFHRADRDSTLTAARALAEGQGIAASDVTSARMREVVGKVARESIHVGQALSSADVAAPVPVPHEPAIALVVAADWASADKPVAIGDAIKVCLGKELIADGKAATSVCDEAGCVVTVLVLAAPAALAGADSVKRLRAVKGDAKGCPYAPSG